MSNCRKAFRRVGCLIHQGTTRTGRKTNGFSGHYAGLVESLQDNTTYFVNDDLVYDCQQFGMASQDMYDKYASSISTLLYEKAERPAQSKEKAGIQNAEIFVERTPKEPGKPDTSSNNLRKEDVSSSTTGVPVGSTPKGPNETGTLSQILEKDDVLDSRMALEGVLNPVLRDTASTNQSPLKQNLILKEKISSAMKDVRVITRK